MKQINEFPQYHIDTDGKILSPRQTHARLSSPYLKHSVSNSGYAYVRFWSKEENKYYSRFVHRVLAETFIPNPQNKSQVNHINGNKLDNRIENLEWVTRNENMRHAYDTGLINMNTLRASRIKKK